MTLDKIQNSIKKRSCVVSGMPKETINIGAVDHVIDIYSIANKAISLLETMYSRQQKYNKRIRPVG